MNPVVDLFFELVFVDEAVDLHGAEEVADALPRSVWLATLRHSYTLATNPLPWLAITASSSSDVLTSMARTR